tara:strand:+ start:8508 stop:9632 length:1125 start_codon:yes stop_codon:yes gene_type:complete
MSIENKQSLAFVVSDINFFFSHRIDLAKKLSDKFEIFVFTDCSKKDKSELLKFNFIKFIHLKTRLNNNILLNILSVICYGINLIALLKSNKIKNVLYITLESSMIGAVASRFLAIKNFFVISGAYVLKEKRIFKLIAITIFSLFKSSKNKFIFQNNEDQLFFEEMLGEGHYSTVIKGNGIDLSNINFNPINNVDTVKFLFASNLFYSKGVADFYNAALNLKNFNYGADFFIAGAYKKNHPLSVKESLYKNIERSEVINYVGAWDQKTFQENIYDYHVFVFPSFGEGMPLTVLEAMASGRALICSNVPGCNSCIHKDLNGYFCVANSTESLTESMKKIIDNKHQISNMGAHSRIIIEKEFNLNKIYKEYLDTIGA